MVEDGVFVFATEDDGYIYVVAPDGKIYTVEESGGAILFIDTGNVDDSVEDGRVPTITSCTVQDIDFATKKIVVEAEENTNGLLGIKLLNAKGTVLSEELVSGASTTTKEITVGANGTYKVRVIAVGYRRAEQGITVSGLKSLQNYADEIIIAQTTPSPDAWSKEKKLSITWPSDIASALSFKVQDTVSGLKTVLVEKAVTSTGDATVTDGDYQTVQTYNYTNELAQQTINVTLDLVTGSYVRGYRITATDDAGNVQTETNTSYSLSATTLVIQAILDGDTSANTLASLNTIVNSQSDMNAICSSSETFTQVAGNSTIMNAICASSVARNAMYNNASVTESILANSETAINSMKACASQYEVVSGGYGLGGTPTLYSYPCFVIGVSLAYYEGYPYLWTSQYVVGDATVVYRDPFNVDSTGLARSVGKFASQVKHNINGSASANSYAAIFKI